jgi:hypothetical protein
VAHTPGDPDALLGWAAYDDARGALIWVYVRELYAQVRRRGLGTALLLELGHDPTTETVPCLFWSPSAAELAFAGKWRLVYTPHVRHERNAA